MSVLPLIPNVESSVLGVGVVARAAKVAGMARLKGKKNPYYKRVDSSDQNTIFIVILSGIILVTIISIYDVIRTYIDNYHAQRTVNNPQFRGDQEDINNTLIANRESLNSSIVFSLMCLFSLILFFYIFQDRIMKI